METPTQAGAQGQHLRRPYSRVCAVQVGQPWAAPSLSLVLYNEIETVHERSFSFHCLILVLPRTPCVCLWMRWGDGEKPKTSHLRQRNLSLLKRNPKHLKLKLQQQCDAMHSKFSK